MTRKGPSLQSRGLFCFVFDLPYLPTPLHISVSSTPEPIVGFRSILINIYRLMVFAAGGAQDIFFAHDASIYENAMGSVKSLIPVSLLTRIDLNGALNRTIHHIATRSA